MMQVRGQPVIIWGGAIMPILLQKSDILLVLWYTVRSFSLSSKGGVLKIFPLNSLLHSLYAPFSGANEFLKHRWIFQANSPRESLLWSITPELYAVVSSEFWKSACQMNDRGTLAMTGTVYGRLKSSAYDVFVLMMQCMGFMLHVL